MQSREDLAEQWSRIALTWVDERCVAIESDDSNRAEAARCGLLGRASNSASAMSPALILPLFENGETPERAVSRTSHAFGEQFSNRIDVALLGMGADGHIASLFPGRTHPADQMVIHVRDSPKPPADRISLTRAALETAEVVILIASGESKRDALTGLISGDATLPAQGLPGLTVVTELELASGEARATEKGDR